MHLAAWGDVWYPRLLPMKVALDASPLVEPSGGTRRYVMELHRALTGCFPEDEFRLVSDQFPRPASWLARRWWLAGVQFEMRRLGTEVFHGTDFSVPYLPTKPSVLTLHDLSPWLDPAWHSKAGRIRHRTPFLLRLGLATMVITHTEAVRRQAIERFLLSPSRVAAIPLAAAPHFRRASPPDGSYFLYVGTLEPRKNLPALVEAWREVRRKHPIDFVLAGRAREDAPKIAPEPGLRLLGPVDEERLPELYSGALACLYPSFYEGFGLPVLEAMQCGAAVLASRDAAIAEVAGDAAALTEASDVRGWAEAMTRAVTDEAWVENLRRRAADRARRYSWERTARATYEVYKEAVARFGW